MDLTVKDIEFAFKAFESQKIDLIMNLFAEDAILYDAHYPVAKMVGKKNIYKGVKWGAKSLKKMRFNLLKIWVDGHEASAKVESKHVLKSGKNLHFTQVFIFKVNSNKKFTLIESYTPYRPSGINGFLLKIMGLFWKK